MSLHRTLLAPLFLFLSLLACAQPASGTLPRSTPEAEGVSSEGLLKFLEAAEKSPFELHGIVVLRHGKVISEAWAKPYGPDLVHTLYSCSKSFTATAIGLAESEGLLSVEDRVISFFPDELPAEISPNLGAMRIKHLLSMTVGQGADVSFRTQPVDSWAKTFLAIPVVHEPGTVFVYNSMATYMLSAIIQKVTRQKLVDYLKPRLFDPLGIQDLDWETDPKGISVGGWGLRLKTEDLAKLGQLFLQKGQWNGRQILPMAWTEAASSLKIMQHPEISAAKRDSSDWEQGYCYQMWRSRHNSYRGDGAYGQYLLVWPELDAVVAINSESMNMQETFNYVWQYIYPAFSNKDELPKNAKALKALQQKSATFALPIPAATPPATIEASLKGKTFALAENSLGATQVAFDFSNNQCQMTFTAKGKSHVLAFGSGQWALGQTEKTPPALSQKVQNYFVGLPPSKIAGAYRWTDAQTLELVLRYLESPHRETFKFQFEGNGVKMTYVPSNDSNNTVVATSRQ